MVGANWESIDSDVPVSSAGELVSVNPESLELNLEILKVRILSAMH